MAEFGFTCIPKELFFDRPKVQSAAAKGKQAAGAKAGAFIRRRAIDSIRRRRASAEAGHAPSSHAGQLKLIFFAFNGPGSVLVGPVRFRAGEAPQLNEFGGSVTRRAYNPRTRLRDGAKYTAVYRPHPFMGPALRTEIAKGTIAGAWAGAVHN